MKIIKIGRKRNWKFHFGPEKKLKIWTKKRPKSLKIGPKRPIFGQNRLKIDDFGPFLPKSATFLRNRPKSASFLRNRQRSFASAFAFGQKLRFWCLRPRFSRQKLRFWSSKTLASLGFLAKSFAFEAFCFAALSFLASNLARKAPIVAFLARGGA